MFILVAVIANVVDVEIENLPRQKKASGAKTADTEVDVRTLI